jgi:threonine synthase
VVGVLTGHVLKDTDAVVKYHLDDLDGSARPGANRPVTIPAELSALERVLTDAIHG